MTHYQLLNIAPTATVDEVRAAYARERARRMAELGTAEASDDIFSDIDAAYATLSDAGQRAAYDRTLRGEPTSAALTLQGAVPAELPVSILAPPLAPVLQRPCPRCGAPNPVQATICRECGGQVSRPCPQCSQPVGLDQTVCPRCQTYVPEYDQRRFAQSLAVEKQVHEERREAEAQKVVADRVYRTEIRLGVVFWSVVIVLCIALSVMATVLSGYLSR